MRFLYTPLPNLLARTALRPVRALVPDRYRFPVTGRLRVRPHGGTPFLLACNPTSYLAKVIFWGGPEAFEPELNAVFRHLAVSSTSFLDVGANIGYYSLLATALSPRLKAVAFEPSPGPHGFLKRNVEINTRRSITVERLAVGAEVGPVVFHSARNPRHPGIPQLGGTGSMDAAQAALNGASDRVEVSGVTLDAYAEEHQTAVDLVKVDVEGAELAVLQGATGLLRSQRPTVLFESLPQVGDRAEALTLFAAHGYAVYLATDVGLTAVSPATDAREGWTNYIAVPADERDRLGPFLSPG